MADYIRAAFIAYEPGGYPNKKRVIPFRFNPEGLSRSITIEPAQPAQGVEAAPGAAPSNSSNQQSADASSGTPKETFSLTMRVDFDDRFEGSTVGIDASGAPENGVLPEIAVLEDLLQAAEAPSDASSDSKVPVKQRALRPTVLLVWGNQRIFPVKITGMTINETLHNSALNPVRAEIEVTMEVLREGDVKNDPAVRDANAFTSRNRKAMSSSFINNAAAQNTNIPRFTS
jgi:hypothetical protein